MTVPHGFYVASSSNPGSALFTRGSCCGVRLARSRSAGYSAVHNQRCGTGYQRRTARCRGTERFSACCCATQCCATQCCAAQCCAAQPSATPCRTDDTFARSRFRARAQHRSGAAFTRLRDCTSPRRLTAGGSAYNGGIPRSSDRVHCVIDER